MQGRLTTIQLITICIILSAGIFIWDLMTPLGVAGGVPYVAVILISLWLPNNRGTYIAAVGCSALTIVGYLMSPSQVDTNWVVFINRAYALMGIWAAAIFILHYRRSSQEALDNERRFRALFEAATEGIIVVDREGDIVLSNPGCERLFGYGPNELASMNIHHLIPQRFREDHTKNVDGYFDQAKPRSMGENRHLYALRSDGTEIPVEISLNSIKMKEGTLAMALITDITERKRRDDEIKKANTDLKKQTTELERSNKELEQFAYVASHDLQEPLRMVSSYTQLLERKYKDKLDEDANEFIHYAVDGARRMQTLINDLLLYSRVGTKGNPFVTVDCAEIVEIVQQNLKTLVKETEAQININDKLPEISADRTQMVQLMQNLLSNAIKFRKPAITPEVNVSCKDLGDMWEFAISDNGIGMDPKYGERIFMIFQRLHHKKDYPGSGIGLAVCKKIVQRHGGKIWYESAPDKGTTFFFTLNKKLN